MTTILFWNLGIYLGISLLEFLYVKLSLGEFTFGYTGILFLLLSLFSIVIQVIINLALSVYFFRKNNSKLGKSFLVSLVVVILVGIIVGLVGVML